MVRGNGASRRRAGSEQGFTLVELLITIAIMGIVSVSMIATMTAIITNSVLNRNASIGEVELRRFAEKVRAAPYLHCGDVAAYNTSDALRDDEANLPPGVTARVVKVDFWVPGAQPGDVSDFRPMSDVHSCDVVLDPNTGEPLPRDDNQLQRITVEVHYGVYTRQLGVVKRVFQ